MKKIGVDLRCLPTDGSPGAGIPHAARELWSALVARHECIGFAGRGARIDHGIGSIVWLPDTSGASLRRALKVHRVDGLFVASGAVPPGLSIPTYPWVHDVAIFEHPEWFPQSWWKRQITTRLFARGLKNAKHIFCVSEDTKQALVKCFHFQSSRLTVTSQGIERLQEEGIGSGSGNFALVMGTVEPRKNIPFLISLWPEVCKRLGRTVELVIAGNDGWGQVLNVKAKGKSFIRKKNVSDEQYHELLQQARVLLTPSLYEGFGRPAVEAMAWGVPVVVSDGGALPEMVADGGQILSLDDPEKWIDAIVRLFQDQKWYEEWTRKAKRRASHFHWETVVSRILEVLSEF